MKLQQLKDALQMLALPITAQVQLDRNEVGRVERLRKYFRDGHRLVRMEMADQLTREQKEVLARLDSLLFCLNPGMAWLVWSEETLRQNADWHQVRAYARKALIKFNWQLDLPSGDLSGYQTASRKIPLEQRPSLICRYT